jgi:uncharacterized Zn finger protein
VAGAHIYRVTVSQLPGQIFASCTCPYDWGGDCKHIVATLLAWLHEPGSFHSAADLRAALAHRSQEELVDLLADMCAAYPLLVDEFDLLADSTDYDPVAAAEEIFAEMEPLGHLSLDAAVTRMQIVARRTRRLVRKGQGDAARRTFYTLTLGCKQFCEDYGASDIFPTNIPYDFALAYQDLARDQLEDHRDAIEREVRELLDGRWAAEMLGIEDGLMEIEAEVLFDDDPDS